MKINIKIILSVAFIGLIAAWLFFEFGPEEEAWADTIISSELILEKKNYDILIDKSELRWKGSKVLGKSHEGTLKVKKGTVEIDKDGFVNGVIIIDMNSLNCTDLSGERKAGLESHLRDDDFFSIDKFSESEIIFKSSNSNNTKMEFNGQLTIKGIEKPISFVAKIEDGDNGDLFAMSKFEFNRTDYDINYASIGDNFIRHEIEIEIELTASPSKD